MGGRQMPGRNRRDKSGSIIKKGTNKVSLQCSLKGGFSVKLVAYF